MVFYPFLYITTKGVTKRPDQFGATFIVALRLGLGFFLFNAPVNNFQSCWDGATASLVFTSTLRSLKCLAQGHYTAVVGFEPWTSRSEVRRSTTEPPRLPSCTERPFSRPILL